MATNGDQARHQTQPSARSATPATQNESGCLQVPCLPRKVLRRHGRLTATKLATRASPVPRLPRQMCMSPCATPATQSTAAPRATNSDQARHQTQPSVSRSALPATQKRRWMSPSAAPAMQSAAASRAITATKRATRASPVPQVPRLPHQTQVNVAKCHTYRGIPRRHGRLTATKQPIATSALSATPATGNEGWCEQVPRMPSKVPRRRHGRLTAQPRHQTQPSARRATPATQNERWMSASAMPATQSAAASRATSGDQARHQTQCQKCHACHAKRRLMSQRATPAMWNEGKCRGATWNEGKCGGAIQNESWMPSATPATSN